MDRNRYGYRDRSRDRSPPRRRDYFYERQDRGRSPVRRDRRDPILGDASRFDSNAWAARNKYSSQATSPIRRLDFRDREYDRRDRGFDRRDSYGSYDSRRPNFKRPRRTKYSILLSNLSPHINWKDLKDLARKYGTVSYSDANKIRKGEGIITYEDKISMKNAYESLNGYEFQGYRIQCDYEFPEVLDRDWDGEIDNNHPGYYTRRSPRGEKNFRSRSRSRGRSRSRSRSMERKDLRRSASPVQEKNQDKRRESVSSSSSSSVNVVIFETTTVHIVRFKTKWNTCLS